MGKEELKVSKISGRKVVWVTWKPIDGKTVYNVYVVIPNSRYLKVEVLGTDVTYRGGDEIGVDSAHRWLDDMVEEDRIQYCVNAIKRIIENCGKVLN